MRDVRSSYLRPVPTSWPSAGIVDARAFRVGNADTIHALTHAESNLVRGACGVTAHVVERDSRLASWAADRPDCSTCLAVAR